MTYYEVLGIAPEASTEEVRKAYHQRSRAAHPDRGGSSEQQQRVNEAYECLSDPMKRSRYDLSLGVAEAEKAGRRVVGRLLDVASEEIEGVAIAGIRALGRYARKRVK